MLKNLLQNALWLRRLVRSNERIAKALEDIRDVYFIESGRFAFGAERADSETASREDDSELLSYTTDAASFDALYGEASRRTLNRPNEVSED